MMKKYNKLMRLFRRGIQHPSVKVKEHSHIRVIAECSETHIIIEGEDAKTFIQRREMQIMKVSRMTPTEVHKVASERARLRESYRSAQKYFVKK